MRVIGELAPDRLYTKEAVCGLAALAGRRWRKHDKHNEIYDRQVKHVFGPSAMLAGSMGSDTALGDVRIQVNGRTVGTGQTFQEALRTAVKTMSGIVAVAGVSDSGSSESSLHRPAQCKESLTEIGDVCEIDVLGNRCHDRHEVAIRIVNERQCDARIN